MSDAARTSEDSRQIIVHLGAHRTGTTLFQEYLYKISPFARDHGYRLIGIDQTRSGLMAGLLGHIGPQGMKSQEAAASLTRLEALIRQAKAEGVGLVVSDENIIGSMEYNLECGVVYPDIKDRLTVLRQAFRHVDRFYLSIRDLQPWWTSCLSYLISTKTSPPTEGKIAEIAQCPRTWTNVVTEIVSAYPQAEIFVREFSYLTANPKRQLIKVSKCKDFEETKRLGKKANRSKDISQLRNALAARGDTNGAARLVGDVEYRPFSKDQETFLRNKYDEDLGWLRKDVSGKHKFLENHKKVT